MANSFYHLPIPTFKTMLCGIGTLLSWVAQAIGYTLFLPTGLFVYTMDKFDKGMKGGFPMVAGLLLTAVVALNIGALLIGSLFLTAPSYEVVNVVGAETDYRYTMEIVERKSDFEKVSNEVFLGYLLGAPVYNHDVYHQFIYDAKTDTWWRAYGIHADLVKIEDAWPWDRKWLQSRSALMDQMNKWMTAHNMECLRNEHVTDLKYEIEQSLREERDREQEHNEGIGESEESEQPEPQETEESDF